MNEMSVKETYAAYINNDDIRYQSSSGGIFTLLAENVINNGGVVYGVAMTDDMYDAGFRRIDKIADLAPLRGSKYFQAKVGDTYKQVKADLLNGITVLFTGTGCQVNGLKCYLQRDYSNLLTVDVLCHGTPSQKIWKMYVDDMEKKHGKVLSISFRNKQNSWADFGMKENYSEDGSIFISKDEDTFMRFFLRNYDLRPACYQCRAKWYKQSDITIADFWGISNVLPEMNDQKGTSLVLVRTDAGEKLFGNIQDKLTVKEVSYEDGVRSNPSEYSSVSRPEQRDTLFEDAAKMTYPELVRKYKVDRDIPVKFSTRVKNKIKRVAKRILKRGGSNTSNQPELNYGMYFIFKKK